MKIGDQLGSDQPKRRIRAAEMLAEGERLVELVDRLPSAIIGEIKSQEPAEAILLAEMLMTRRHYERAAHYYMAAWELMPARAGNQPIPFPHNAPCVAVMAAVGNGEGPRPDGAASVALRRQALDWLRAEMKTWSEAMNRKTSTRGQVIQALRSWKSDPDLAGVRDPAGLAALPEAERDAWRALWGEVEQLLAEARRR